MWQEIVQWWWSIAPYLKTPAPIVISLIALSVTFRDRRPRLLVRPRKGSTHNPYKLCPTAQGGLAFLGGTERSAKCNSRLCVLAEERRRGLDRHGKPELQGIV